MRGPPPPVRPPTRSLPAQNCFRFRNQQRMPPIAEPSACQDPKAPIGVALAAIPYRTGLPMLDVKAPCQLAANGRCRKTRCPKLGLSRKDYLVDGARPLKEALAHEACPCGSASRSSPLVSPYSSKRSASLVQCSDIFRRIAARLTETAHPWARAAQSAAHVRHWCALITACPRSST